MTKKYIDIINELPIGNTPIIKLKIGIFLKLEYLNFGGSVKSRVAKYMIKNAINNEELSFLKDKTILEASGGNTAIGLIKISTRIGWNCVFCIPDNYSKDRIEELKAYGATIYLSDHKNGNNSHIILAKSLKKRNPNWYYFDQINNTANVDTHYNGTGIEILEQVNKIDFFISGIGSGGTITGVGRRIKNTSNNIIGVIPKGYSIKEKKFISHNIQGIGIGIIPSVLDLSIIDDYIEISDNDIINTAKYLLKEENLLVGLSSIANIAAAIKIKNTYKSSKNIVTIAPDHGLYYREFYKKLFEELL